MLPTCKTQQSSLYPALLLLPVLQVDKAPVVLSAAAQNYSGVDLSVDQNAVKAHIPSINVTLTFDGTTAHFTGRQSHPAGRQWSSRLLCCK